jgi:hypothetical protein
MVEGGNHSIWKGGHVRSQGVPIWGFKEGIFRSLVVFTWMMVGLFGLKKRECVCLSAWIQLCRFIPHELQGGLFILPLSTTRNSRNEHRSPRDRRQPRQRSFPPVYFGLSCIGMCKCKGAISVQRREGCFIWQSHRSRHPNPLVPLGR